MRVPGISGLLSQLDAAAPTPHIEGGKPLSAELGTPAVAQQNQKPRRARVTRTSSAAALPTRR